MFSLTKRTLTACLVGLASLTACAPVYTVARKVGMHSGNSLKAAEEDYLSAKDKATKVVAESSAKAQEIISAGRAIQSGGVGADARQMPDLVQNFSTVIADLKSKKVEFESSVKTFEDELSSAFERWQVVIKEMTDEQLARQQEKNFQRLRAQSQISIRKSKEALAALDAALVYAKNVAAVGRSTQIASDVETALQGMDSKTSEIMTAAANYNMKANEALALLAPQARNGSVGS